jgi:nitrogen fixation NifU-like protein
MNEEKIINAWQSPGHQGVAGGVIGRWENPECGDVVQLDILVESGIIKKAAHSGDGCVLSQAGAELLCQHLEGKPIESAVLMSQDDMLSLFEGRPLDIRLPCCLLPWQALQSVLYGLKLVA